MGFFSDLIQYGYLSNALAACVLSGITCGVIGTYVVCRRMVFLAGGITHASFGGLGIAFWMGANPIAGAMIFAVLSALGMYQAEPAGGRYFFGSPAVDGATLRVRGGEFRITAADNSPENIYIQRITLNGEAYRKYYIDYAEIAAGGELRFEMGPEPADWTKQQPL